MKPIEYFSLVNADGKEVYTSLCYTLDNAAFDYGKVMDVFKFYLDRINSGIKQQLESPKLTQEQKSALKFIDPSCFKIQLCELHFSGGYSVKKLWAKSLADFSEMKGYRYT